MSKKRDIGQELLDGVRAIKAGKGKRRVVELSKDVKEIRERLGLVRHRNPRPTDVVMNDWLGLS